MKKKLAAATAATVVLLAGPFTGTAHAASSTITVSPNVGNKLCDYFPWVCHR